MVKLTRILKIISLWFIINTALAIIIFSFIAINSTSPLPSLFLSTLIITHTISSLSAITGHSLGNLFKNKHLMVELPFVLSGTLCAAIIGIIISQNIVKNLFNYNVFHSKTDYLIPSLLITAVVTILAITIERLKKRSNELEKNMNIIKTSDSQQNSLSIKEDEIYHVIKCNDLIYLSSHGKKSTLHTTHRDYETNQLLKDIEKKISADNFIRIHKQFIINTKYLSQVKYYEGGRYMAYLNDDDESALPVGRKIVPVLKKRLGI